MTTIATVIGKVLIAIASGAGAVWKNGLACVVIGGLLSLLFLIQVIVPVMYGIFDKIINRLNRGKNKQPISELMAEECELKPHHSGILDHEN